MSDLSKQYSKEKAEYKAKIESDRRAQAKALQEEADRSAKSQKEISDFQKMLVSFREKQAIQMISFQKNSVFFFFL